MRNNPQRHQEINCDLTQQLPNKRQIITSPCMDTCDACSPHCCLPVCVCRSQDGGGMVGEPGGQRWQKHSPASRLSVQKEKCLSNNSRDPRCLSATLIFPSPGDFQVRECQATAVTFTTLPGALYFLQASARGWSPSGSCPGALGSTSPTWMRAVALGQRHTLVQAGAGLVQDVETDRCSLRSLQSAFLPPSFIMSFCN